MSEHIHLIGIGGSGLSAIARLLLESGYTVSGSDRVISPLANELAQAGARVFSGHRAENIAGAETVTLDYEMMPRATYCQPQIASFGITEAQAKERGYTVKIGRFPFQANGKALGLGDYAGWVKLVVDEKYGEILGASMIGPEVTELLPELTLAHMLELTPAEIARNVHAHPTLSEAIMEAAHAATGQAIHT